ncbi:MAG: SprT family zinc-dependent metalloprotease [Caldimonas sp.]
MTAPIGKHLLRLVDSLQRSLFDDAGIVAEPPGGVFAHAEANRRVVHDGHAIAFLLRRARRRSIGFIVGPEGLVVSAPRWVTLRDIDAAVREKAPWIVARLVEQRELSVRIEARRIVWADGAMLRYLGGTLVVALEPGLGDGTGATVLESAHAGASAPAASPAAVPRRLRVGLPVDAAAERIRDAVQSWLQREARRVFEERVAVFSERLGVRVSRLGLSSARTRWGSASASGAVRLHWKLIHHALPTIDYVVAHELAHLREMNHGPRFWDLVRSVVPHLEAARRELHGEPPSPAD